jgi:uncharacterized membrane protein YeaQ/YmgE (transglycosylase-associated protein family)
MIYLIVNNHGIETKTLTWIITILYALVVGAIHGIIAHTLKPERKGSLMFYPVMMGMLFGLLAFIYILVILPQVIPGFY